MVWVCRYSMVKCTRRIKMWSILSRLLKNNENKWYCSPFLHFYHKSVQWRAMTQKKIPFKKRIVANRWYGIVVYPMTLNVNDIGIKIKRQKKACTWKYSHFFRVTFASASSSCAYHYEWVEWCRIGAMKIRYFSFHCVFHIWLGMTTFCTETCNS